MRRAAVCAGACGKLLDDAIAQRVDFYLTGEMRHHDALKAARIPLGGKQGDLERDLVPVMIFLASDDSRFITGQIIYVAGGQRGPIRR